MNNDNILKNYKLYFLQERYILITKHINKLQYHIENIFQNYFINKVKKNIVLSQLFEISHSINNKFNNYANQNFNENDINHNKINNVKNKFNITNDNIIFDNIIKYETISPLNIKLLSINKPLEYIYEKLYQIMSQYGYPSLKEMLLFILKKPNFNLLENDVINIINELNNIVVPLSFDFFDVSEKKESHYWRDNKKYQINDNLELVRELWIKNPSLSSNYLKITLYFKVDILSTFIKTCQINYPYIYNKKIKILNIIEKKNPDINYKFAKAFIRHNYLGNIYSLSILDYVKYLKLSYYNHIELLNTTFLNLMKDFVAKDNTIKKMYDTIFLFLLGDEDMIDIAGLLFGIIKEKKTNTYNLYNYIFNHLTYFLQLKIKQSNINMKNELEKIKSLNIEDIDYKKQIIANKFIPTNVKTITLEKIEEMKSYNNEYYKQLTFVKSIINYPWNSTYDDMLYKNLNLNKDKARDFISNVEHKLKTLSYGHDEAKKLLLQIIGKWITNPEGKGTCFGLVGPPGVGKTLLAKTVGEALNIPFAQITLGGQNDGELLHGHGYTYSGSQPGLIIKKMVEMSKARCIIYFDELDKTCLKHGQINEITSILIHLTDPNMNRSFQDRFFQGVDFPLDKVIFIFSYNDSSLVDPILLDRIKELQVTPYTITDKINICKSFLINKIEKNIGFEKNTIKINNNLIEFIIDNYTNEAGVRDIKRKLENIYLNLNLDMIFKRGLFTKKTKGIKITKKEIIKILSKPKLSNTCIGPKPEVGIINGLYATANGDGGIIPIQVFHNYSSSVDSFEIKLTGKQGDVMKESVSCSLTASIEYINRNINKYKNIDNLNNYLDKNFKHGFHIHAPSTSVPKDGPSAGCAFTTAFISRILNKPIRNNVAMTGEVELTGRITKIGGLNYKLIGAKKAGVELIFIPKENEKDLKEIKIKHKKLFNKNFVVKTFEYIDEIIDQVLIL